MIVGIDEVGRGPWAGPLVVGAVILGGDQIDGLTDSKKLSRKKRELLNEQIRTQATAVGLGWVGSAEIDEIGLSKALTLGCIRALEEIKTPYHEIIIDGTINFLQATGKGPYVTTMKKADLLVPSVSAASIVAKVARDEWMKAQDDIYNGYHFAAHVGYGTAAHVAAIEANGLTPLHRRSFAPVGRYAATHTTKPVSPNVQKTSTTKAIGDSAETVACEWLVSDGYDITARNWKTKFCEIDIVASKNNVFYFVEVKHRKKLTQGGGLAAITKTKLRQMKFAAELYRLNQKMTSYDARLAVITTTGEQPVFEQWLEVE